MGGGLMQLVAYGAQDIYLTGNPQITFFKVVYRRHTNFSMETISQTLNGSQTAVSANQTATCTISRNGDLVHKVYVTFATAAADTEGGSKLVKEVELEIGGQRIDRHYQEWNDVWNELSTPESKAIGLKSMQLDVGTGGVTGSGVTNAHIPLNFWFCRNPGLALPLIALQYHEVKLKFTWGALSGTPNPEVWCDYVYLDTDERRRFAQVSHEYLIEQLQKEDKTTTVAATNHKLNFNHPVKELVWTYDASATMSKIKLQLNGHDRFSEQTEEYFTLRQPFDYHTAVPRQNLPLAGQQTFYNDNQGTILSPTTGAGDNLSSEVFKGIGANGAIGANEFIYDSSTGTLTLMSSVITTVDDDKLVVGDQLLVSVTQAESAAIVPGQYLGTVSGGTGISGTSGNFTEAGGKTITFESGLVRVGDIAATLLASTAADEAATTILQVVGKYTRNVSQARTSKMARKVGVYSFALKPEEHQPSGTCNFSRIDNAQLSETTAGTGGTLSVYAVNYNVLRIMSGMGGLAYSN